MRRSLGLALALVAAAACGGGTTPITQIVVVVDSDLNVPGELDSVTIEVSGGTGDAQTTTADLRAQALPRSLGLVHVSGPLGPIHVSVEGTLNGSRVIDRSATVSFEQDKSILLQLPLARTCANAPACGDGVTCDQGRCIADQVSDLPSWDGEVAPFDVAGGGGHSGGGAGRGGSSGASAGRGGASGAAVGGGGAGDSGMPDADMPNAPPVCTISQPMDGASFSEGDTVMFAGSCSDPETGPLSSGLRWDSDRDGLLGVVAKPTRTNLSVGKHTITFCATDPTDAGIKGCATIRITVVALPAITAKIDSLTQTGTTSTTTFSSSASIVAMGSGTGVDPVTLAWTDSMVGAISNGSSATLSAPLIGRHRLELVATDMRMRTASDSKTFSVLAANQTALIAPYMTVNVALTSAGMGSGRVDALAADTTNYFVAADAPVVLFEFAATIDPATSLVAPSVADPMPPGVIHDVLLHSASGTAYISTAVGFQTCTYAVNSGIDMSSCGGHQTGNNVATILRITVGSADYLLIGTNNGLFVPDNPAQPDNSLTNLQKTLPINGLAADNQNLWVATSGGLYAVSLTATKPFKDDSVFKLIAGPVTNLSDIALGASDSVWVGSPAGLARYTPSTGTWQMWSAAGSGGPPALASNDVRALAVSHPVIAGATRDVIWIATAAGVSRFDSQLESFTTFTSSDGLPSDSIRAVLVLANGDKLFGTDSGIALYKGL